LTWATSGSVPRTLKDLIGLIPAAGHASRLAPLPCSKELFPVGFYESEGGHGPRAKPVCLYLLDGMRLAGAEKVYMVLREGKWDIPAFLGDGAKVGLSLAYLMTGPNGGPAHTLNQAFPFVREATVLFGFPDIIFQPKDAFASLLFRLAATGADIALAAFPAHDPQSLDMLDMDKGGHVRALEIKPGATRLSHAWMAAAWSPNFTLFMHDQIAATRFGPGDRECSVGRIIQAALREGLRVEAVIFSEGSYLDIGTPNALVRAVRDFA
jgi:glucose-1-phosphate thymidylyltransferase